MDDQEMRCILDGVIQNLSPIDAERTASFFDGIMEDVETLKVVCDTIQYVRATSQQLKTLSAHQNLQMILDRMLVLMAVTTAKMETIAREEDM